MAKEKLKLMKMKPVMNNGKANSPLQWNVKKDTDEFKRVTAKDVFEGYKSNVKKKKINLLFKFTSINNKVCFLYH